LDSKVDGNNATIYLKAKVGGSTTAYTTYLSEIYYMGDWNQDKLYIYRFYDPDKNIWDTSQKGQISSTINITKAPEGQHTVTIYVLEKGGYLRNGYAYGFSITGWNSFNFSVDSTPPIVSILGMADKVYDTSDIPVSFAINEPASSISYSLDSGANVTINGNTTLLDLASGVHNLTIYSWDASGNIGKSDQIYFYIEKPVQLQDSFLMTLAVSIAIISIVFAIISIIWHSKRGKHPKKNEGYLG
jgi:hypothetical protein